MCRGICGGLLRVRSTEHCGSRTWVPVRLSSDPKLHLSKVMQFPMSHTDRSHDLYMNRSHPPLRHCFHTDFTSQQHRLHTTLFENMFSHAYTAIKTLVSDVSCINGIDPEATVLLTNAGSCESESIYRRPDTAAPVVLFLPVAVAPAEAPAV